MKRLISACRSLSRWAGMAISGSERTDQASLRRTELASATGKCFAVLAAFGFISYQGYSTATANGLQIADTLATTVAAYTDQTLGSSALVLKSVVDSVRDTDPQTEDDLLQLTRTRRQFDELRQIIRNEEQVDVASIIALDGTLLTYSRSFPPPQQNLGERDYFRAALEMPAGAVFLSKPVQNKTNGAWTFYLATAIRSRSDGILGVAIVGIQTQFFSDFFSRVSLGKGNAITLYQDSGVVLARSDGTNATVGIERRLDNIRHMLEAGPAPAARIFHDASGPPALTVASTRILAPRQLTQFPALVVVAIGEGLYLAHWLRTNYFVGGAALLVMVGIVLALRRNLRVLAEQEAHRRQEQNRRLMTAIVESPSALTAIVNRDGDVIHANQRFWDALQSVGIHGPGVLRSPSLRGADRLLEFAAESLQADAQSTTLEIQIIEEGRKAFLHLSATRQHLAGIGPCVVLVGHDETERLQTQAALVQSAKLVTLGELATGVAHELNQPLFVILMAAQNALADIKRSDKVRDEAGNQRVARLEGLMNRLSDKFGQITAQVKRASAIIQNMQVFGRSADTEASIFDVRDACRAAIDLVREQLRVSGIRLEEAYGHGPLLVKGVQRTLEQVVLNLVINARDALRDEVAASKTIVVTAHAEQEAQKIVVGVADNGPGIPEGIRERIFDPFFTTKPVGQGVGLGLSISYGIVRDMDGSLKLADVVAGASFRIELPMFAGAPLNVVTREPAAAAGMFPR